MKGLLAALSTALLLASTALGAENGHGGRQWSRRHADAEPRAVRSRAQRTDEALLRARQFNPHASGSHVLTARQAGPSVLPPTQPTTEPCQANAQRDAAGLCACVPGYAVSAAGTCTLVIIQPTVPAITSFIISAGGTVTTVNGVTTYQLVKRNAPATLVVTLNVTPGSTNTFSWAEFTNQLISSPGTFRLVVTDATPAGRLRKRAAGDVLCDTGNISINYAGFSGQIVDSSFPCYVASASQVTLTFTLNAPVGTVTLSEVQGNYTQQGPCVSACNVTFAPRGPPAPPIVPTTCPDGQTTDTSGAACVTCISLGRLSSTGGQCGVACPAGVPSLGTTCSCPAGTAYVSGACQTTALTCPDGQTPNADATACVTCASKALLNGVGGACGDACAGGFTLVANSCVTCNSQNFIVAAHACGVACPTGAIASGPTCVCPNGSSYTSGQCLSCTSQNLATNVGGQCEAVATCADGSPYQASTNSCLVCNAANKINAAPGSTVCGADCPAGAVANGLACSCPFGQVWSASTNTCSCPGFATVVGQQCVACSNQSPTLPNGATAGTCGTACPGALSVQLSGACGCSVGVVEGTACLCPPTSEFVSGACVSCMLLGRQDGSTVGGGCSAQCLDPTQTLSGTSCGCGLGATKPAGAAACACTEPNFTLVGTECKCAAGSQLTGQGQCALCSSVGRKPGLTADSTCLLECVDDAKVLPVEAAQLPFEDTACIACPANSAKSLTDPFTCTCTDTTKVLSNGVAAGSQCRCADLSTDTDPRSAGSCMACAALGREDSTGGSCGGCKVGLVLDQAGTSCVCAGSSGSSDFLAGVCTCASGFSKNALNICVPSCTNPAFVPNPSGGACDFSCSSVGRVTVNGQTCGECLNQQHITLTPSDPYSPCRCPPSTGLVGTNCVSCASLNRGDLGNGICGSCGAGWGARVADETSVCVKNWLPTSNTGFEDGTFNGVTLGSGSQFYTLVSPGSPGSPAHAVQVTAPNGLSSAFCFYMPRTTAIFPKPVEMLVTCRMSVLTAPAGVNRIGGFISASGSSSSTTLSYVDTVGKWAWFQHPYTITPSTSPLRWCLQVTYQAATAAAGVPPPLFDEFAVVTRCDRDGQVRQSDDSCLCQAGWMTAPYAGNNGAPICSTCADLTRTDSTVVGGDCGDCTVEDEVLLPGQLTCAKCPFGRSKTSPTTCGACTLPNTFEDPTYSSCSCDVGYLYVLTPSGGDYIESCASCDSLRRNSVSSPNQCGTCKFAGESIQPGNNACVPDP